LSSVIVDTCSARGSPSPFPCFRVTWPAAGSADPGAHSRLRDGQYRFRLAGICSVGAVLCGLSYLMFGYEFRSAPYVCLTAILLDYCRDDKADPSGRR